jgi:hypothetical protein
METNFVEILPWWILSKKTHTMVTGLKNAIRLAELQSFVGLRNYYRAWNLISCDDHLKKNDKKVLLSNYKPHMNGHWILSFKVYIFIRVSTMLFSA